MAEIHRQVAICSVRHCHYREHGPGARMRARTRKVATSYKQNCSTTNNAGPYV